MRAADDIVTPQSFIHYLRDVLDLRPSDIRLPSRGVIVFGSEDFETFRRAIHGRRARRGPWQCTGRAGRRRVFLARSQIGGPAAAIVTEEMGARGVREFVTFGACGSLRDDLPIGSIVVPTFAHADEGTSRHYGAPRRPRPSSSIVRAIQDACERNELDYSAAGVWTTDAPYRESHAIARALARQGVVAVDMEASALFAVARYRGYRAGSLMVVSDELGGESWNPGFRDLRFRRAKRKGIRTLVDALSRPWP